VTNQQSAGWGLELVTYFLNLDLDSVGNKDLAGNFLLQTYLGSMLEQPGGRKAAKDLKEEVKQLLQPIVAPQKQLSPEDAYRLLSQLELKGNKAVDRPRWGILPMDYDIYCDEETGKEIVGSCRLEAEEIEEMNKTLSAGYREVHLLGYRWAVGLSHSISSWPGYIYGTLLKALNGAELTRIKVCEECKKFFVQANARQRFCGNLCRDEFNNKRRLKSGYFSHRRKSKRETQAKRARRLLREGKTPAKVAKETGLSVGILRREGLVK